MMTRKHYEKAAEIVRQIPGVQRTTTLDAFVEFFSDDNPRFDRVRFTDACFPEAIAPITLTVKRAR